MGFVRSDKHPFYNAIGVPCYQIVLDDRWPYTRIVATRDLLDGLLEDFRDDPVAAERCGIDWETVLAMGVARNELVPSSLDLLERALAVGVSGPRSPYRLANRMCRHTKLRGVIIYPDIGRGEAFRAAWGRDHPICSVLQMLDFVTERVLDDSITVEDGLCLLVEASQIGLPIEVDRSKIELSDGAKELALAILAMPEW